MRTVRRLKDGRWSTKVGPPASPRHQPGPSKATSSAPSLGFSVATAGDVNGDGFSDVIAGAPYFDNGEEDEGRAFVYHGAGSGVTTTAAWTAGATRPVPASAKRWKPPET